MNVQLEELPPRKLATYIVYEITHHTNSQELANDYLRTITATFSDTMEAEHSSESSLQLLAKMMGLIVALRTKELNIRTSMAFLIAEIIYETNTQDAEDAAYLISDELDNLLDDNRSETTRKAVTDILANWYQKYGKPTK